MDLFDYMKSRMEEKEAPLAMRMRPRTLDEVIGQEHMIGKGRLLYRAISADKLSSVLFYGPPGTGKTTIAKVIANTTRASFVQLNATTSGKKEMEEAVRDAKQQLGGYGRRTILFIDEIHRFNKAQQDYLLPFVEDGTVILIGATTENPYFEVNPALLSRSTIFELKPLTSNTANSTSGVVSSMPLKAPKAATTPMTLTATMAKMNMRNPVMRNLLPIRLDTDFNSFLLSLTPSLL